MLKVENTEIYGWEASHPGIEKSYEQLGEK